MPQHNSRYVRYGKRCVDLAVCIPALLVLWPAYVLLAWLILWRLGRPVLFWQRRPGLHGVPFWMMKFRTMTSGRDAAGKLLPDDLRITPLGRFLRATSLDELPELWHVVSGKMSLVGPRPLLLEYATLYTQEQARRHLIKPGITGWAQVNGRNRTTWEERFRDDLWYLDHASFWVDVRILWRTLPAVIRQKNVCPRFRATMPRFGAACTAKDDHDRAS